MPEARIHRSVRPPAPPPGGAVARPALVSALRHLEALPRDASPELCRAVFHRVIDVFEVPTDDAVSGAHATIGELEAAAADADLAILRAHTDAAAAVEALEGRIAEEWARTAALVAAIEDHQAQVRDEIYRHEVLLEFFLEQTLGAVFVELVQR